jgi:hypothetical protein
VFACAWLVAGAVAAQQRFSDDFERGLKKWEILGDDGVWLHDSGDPAHGHVLLLRPRGSVLALIPGSDRWGPVRIEGDVMFPTDEHSYLGVAYDYRRRGDRQDFGVVYIKGNGSYLMVNPRRDLNVGRTLYEEFHVDLEGDAAIRMGEWKRFRAEVDHNVCHFYVGDVETPQLTFSFLEWDGGMAGLEPRSVGGDVWVDNVVVTSIRKLSYKGPPRPAGIQYDPEALLTGWTVVGPLTQADDAIAEDPDGVAGRWQPFETDARGAVITGRVVDFLGPNTVAYFRTQIGRDEAGPAYLRLSTVDDLALWVNGRFRAFIPRGDRAWYDFWRNDQHEGERVAIDLVTGKNDIVLRVRGGVYASGGFFARVERAR